MVRQFLASPLAEHLKLIDDSNSEDASGGTLLNTESIKEEIENLAPGALIFPFGYLPLWSSVGGNQVVYGLREAAFYWVDYTAFDADNGSMFLQGTNTEVEYNSDNITQGMLLISQDSPEKFLDDLRKGNYEARLDDLDLNA